MFGLGMQELLIVGVVAVVLFGKRLPEVASSLGASYREFRKGLLDIQSQFHISDTAVYNKAKSPSAPSAARRQDDIDQYDQPTAPKFEMPAADDSGSTSNSGSTVG